uniref:Uncharacterized protein n=1 Tax=Mustela putorius furo TaxID=9669 RepID=M3YML9_MUSPF
AKFILEQSTPPYPSKPHTTHLWVPERAQPRSTKHNQDQPSTTKINQAQPRLTKHSQDQPNTGSLLGTSDAGVESQSAHLLKLMAFARFRPIKSLLRCPVPIARVG